MRSSGVALLAVVAIAGCGDRSAEAAGGESGAPTVSSATEAMALDTATLAAIPADSVYALGKTAYDATRWREATAIWQLGLERARHADDATGEARYLTWLGLAAYRMDEYREAGRLERAALAVQHEHGLRESFPTTYNALGLIAWQQGRLEEARMWYDSVFAAAEAAGDASYHAKALVNLGLVETGLGEIDSARRHTRQGLEAFRELGDTVMEARTLANLAALERDAGNPRMALEWALQAVELGRTTADDVGEEAALGQLASLYLLLGRHEDALATVDSALIRARASGLRDAEAANLEILAGLHRQLGHLPRALRLYDSAHAINRSLDEKRYEAGLDLYHMAEIQVALGNLDVARIRVEGAREIHRETGWTTAELADLLLLAEIEELAGAPGTGDEHLATAGDLAAGLGLRSSRLDVALTRARIADHRGDPGWVLETLDAIEDDLSVAGFAREAEAAALRARAQARRGELAAAEVAGRAAIQLVQAARRDLTSGLLRSTLAHNQADTHAILADVLLRQGRIDEAFVVAASALTRPDGPETPSGREAERLDELRRRIDQLSSEIRDTELYFWNPDRVAGSVERLRQARREYQRLLDVNGGSAAPVGTSSIVLDAAGVRSALRPDEALLQYLIGDESAFAFVVRNEATWGTRLAVSPEVLATRIRLARRLLGDPGAADATAVLESLHAELLGSAEAGGHLAGVDRLIVVPHGVVTYLPFAALRNPATGRWLAEEVVLQHLPAAAMLTSIDRDRSSVPIGLDEPGAVFAPRTAELPGTREEARAVAAMLAENSTVRMDGEATEPAFRRALGTTGIVHIASHAELDVANPLHSGIRLAAQRRTPAYEPADDGRLEVRELRELSIRSPLVFLSGCETGLGAGWSSSYAVGEDFATLERGFLEAGAGSVLATLWRIEDRSAAEFARRFYQHLRGTDPATALASAQRDMMSDPRSAHPFHWAAYRVAGEGRRE